MATKEIVLDENATTITLGRDAQNDIVIADRKASRLHARVERRRDKFVIVDQSSNGTFVTVDGEPEIMLRREELMLRGRGRVTSAMPTSTTRRSFSRSPAWTEAAHSGLL